MRQLQVENVEALGHTESVWFAGRLGQNQKFPACTESGEPAAPGTYTSPATVPAVRAAPGAGIGK